MSDLTGEKIEHLKKSVGAANAHYPERSYVIFVVNAPVWFSFIWKIVKPLVHENTQKKVKILSKRETLQGLQEHLDISQIPEYYGGELDFGGHDSCRFKSPQVLEMERFVRELNAEATQDVFNDNASPASPLPPGQRGMLAENALSPATELAEPNDDVWSVCSGRTTGTTPVASATSRLSANGQ
jgi:hypothetical protein